MFALEHETDRIIFETQCKPLAHMCSWSENPGNAIIDIMKTPYEIARLWLRSQLGEAVSSRENLARLKTSKATANRVFTHGKDTSAEDFMRWLDDFGAKIIFPGQTAQGVCELGGLAHCAARMAGDSGCGGCEIPFDAKGFLAVPFVEQHIAADSMMIPEQRISEWMIVYAHKLSDMSRNLCAVRLSEQQDAMIPTLHPGDILLIDKGAVCQEMADPQPPGNIFMVREPDANGVLAIKRVVFEREDLTMRMVFYSDNARGHPPRVHNFEKAFGADVRRALVGRIVWAWSDMTRK